MKFNTVQWIAIAVSVALLAGIYLFADTKKLPSEKPAGPGAARDAQSQQARPFDWGAYLAKVKAGIGSKDTLSLISGLEKEATNASLKSLIGIYHSRGESIAEAYYSFKLAESTHDLQLMDRSAKLFTDVSELVNDNELHQYLTDQEVLSCRRLMDWDSTTAHRIRLATAYLDQGVSPMQGVGMLLDVVAKDSGNADALFQLGRFGLVSKQYDKAIGRLEKVVSLRPQNYDALFLLAEAYLNKGDKQKAVELLEKCSRMVDKPELKKELDQYILKIKSNS